MGRFLTTAIVLAASAICSPAGAAPQPLTLRATATQLLALEARLERAGNVSGARAILEALLADPNPDVRNEARFREAKLLAAQQANGRAAVLLRQILDEKPRAVPVRLELAGLLDRMGDNEGAWRQLRAVQASGLPPAVARIVDRYSEALRAQRPFGASLEIALAPDSNINRATRSDTLGTVLGNFDISEDSKARSGTGLALDGQVYTRLPLGGDTSLLARATAIADLYRHKQFNDVAAGIAAGPEFEIGRSLVQVELGATQGWYGQKPFVRSESAGATVSHPLGGRTLVRVSGSAALLKNQLNALESGKAFSGQASVEHALSPTTGVAASFSFDRESLRDPGYANTSVRGALTGWQEMGRMTVTVSTEVGRLAADDRLMLFPDKRQDHYFRFSLGATFRRLQFRGFSPVLRFSIERNRSTIAFYDYRRNRTEVGMVHAF